jgi:oligopeptide transport system ATP-binding protein
MSEPLMKIENLKKHFPITQGVIRQKVRGFVHAVDGIDFTIRKGETFGLVGESGSGKTTTGRLLIRLIEPTSGNIWFSDKNIIEMDHLELRELRANYMGIVFQDPFSSLDPRKTIFNIIGEPLEIKGVEKAERQERILELIQMVDLGPEHVNRYPHEFSGGQRQRIAIARALALNPSFVVLDEPVSALDVSIRAQLLNLLQDLRKNLGLTFLFISHDMSVVKYISDVIGVMYLGKMMELSSSDELFIDPLHPYTRALLSSIPIPDPELLEKRETTVLKGSPPSSINLPKGCRFNTRCPIVGEICTKKEPELIEKKKGHLVACHFA